MFSNKNKEKDSKYKYSYESKTQTQTTQTLTVRNNYETRSHSVSYNTRSPLPSLRSGSLPKLDNHLLTPNYKTVPTSSTSIRPRSAFSTTDAVPIPAPVSTPTPINLNYQSPYRNSPVYRSFQSPRPPPTSLTVRSPIPSKPTSTPPEKLPKKAVKKTGKYYDQQNSSITYQTHSSKRGEVLIINNIMFKDNKQYRNGAKEDDKQMKSLFTQMGFSVTVHRDLKRAAMESKVRDFSKKSSLRTSDIAIMVIMSHGTKNTTLGDTEVFGVDEEGVLVEDLLSNFTDEKCKNMQGKPKIFIFQCCRGDNEQFVQSDARPAPISALHDALIAYSTLPGFVSYRHPDNGTWYIQTLCDVFSEHAHEYHVEDMLKMVDVKMGSMGGSTRQTSSYVSRGFKRCFLHPK